MQYPTAHITAASIVEMFHEAGYHQVHEESRVVLDILGYALKDGLSGAHDPDLTVSMMVEAEIRDWDASSREAADFADWSYGE